MADTFSALKRSEIMSLIRSKDTTPEKIIRSLLHISGFRFRLHKKDLPGKPDITLSKYKAVVMIHGCFWHGHECKRIPGSNTEFWTEKINRNKKRDTQILENLNKKGWKVLTIWECATRGRGKLPNELLASECNNWLLSGTHNHQLKGAFTPIVHKN